MSLQSNIWKIYLYTFLKNFSVVLPIWYLFLEQYGLSVFQIMILGSIVGVAGGLFEIPSGVFADKLGRKTSIILGSFLNVVGFFLLAISTQFWAFAGSYALIALAFSLVSGADQALLYDTLLALKRKKEYLKRSGALNALVGFGMALGSLAGGYIALVSFQMNYFVLCGILFAAFLVSFSLTEAPYKKSKKKSAQHLLLGLKFSFSHDTIRGLIIYGAITVGGLLTLFGLYQPYLTLRQVDLYLFGYLYAIFLIVASIASLFAHRIEKALKEKGSFLLLLLSGFIPFIILPFVHVPWSYLFLIIPEIAYGLSIPLITNYINHHITSSKRATVNSITNFAQYIFWALFAPFIGLLVDQLSLGYGLLIGGVIGSFALLFTLPFLFKK